MSTSLSQSIDALGHWRRDVEGQVKALQRFLAEQDLLDEASGRLIDALRLRLGADKLVVAFVAEFSRGKSELINAIFFADTGRRVLPATPGRTTMCPVELGFDPAEPPGMALLPIETRLDSVPLAEWRQRPQAWKLIELDPSDAHGLSRAMQSVTSTRWVTLEEARALGFWSDERPEENPTTDAHGRVEVPAWRHAMINFPHPLLRQGLVVLDTPGLNAIGAEPELTLGLLPAAHAAVFILGADTGVTRSDLSVWKDHLGPQSLSCFVALNKIDMLNDPLLSAEEIEAQIQRQREQVALTLELSTERVFPLSARQALNARIDGNTSALDFSRLPALEAALATQLLPHRRHVLSEAVLQMNQAIQTSLQNHLGDRRRQLAEQMIELRGLRGKNDGKVGLLLRRVEVESEEFEQCVARLQGMRSVHKRMLDEALSTVSSDRVRDAVEGMRSSIRSSVLNLGARRAFGELCVGLRDALSQGQAHAQEIQAMLGSYFSRLNTDFGFSLACPPAPDLTPFQRDLDLIERNYEQYLGFTQSLRLSQPRFLEQFRRMLVSRLRVVFEGACTEIEHWNKAASAQVDGQLRERRKDFRRRRESLERIQGAGTELESRIAELEAQHEQMLQTQARLLQLLGGIAEQAKAPGSEHGDPHSSSTVNLPAALHGVPSNEGSDQPSQPAQGDAAADTAEPMSMRDLSAPPPAVDILLELEPSLPRLVRAS